MIWEENSRVIVMLTRLMEKGSVRIKSFEIFYSIFVLNLQNKCWLYYPDNEYGKELTFNDVDLKVSFVSDRQYRHYTQRRFDLIHLSVNTIDEDFDHLSEMFFVFKDR